MITLGFSRYFVCDTTVRPAHGVLEFDGRHVMQRQATTTLSGHK